MRKFLGFILEDDANLNEKLWDAFKYAVTTMKREVGDKVIIQVIVIGADGTTKAQFLPK